MSPLWGKPAPANALEPFCTMCGHKMRWLRWQGGFDGATGLPLYRESWMCETQGTEGQVGRPENPSHGPGWSVGRIAPEREAAA